MDRALIYSTLHKYFGFAQFRNGQEEIISSILYGNDTLSIMPTGGGKSLCYQLPALLMNGTALVVSPLIALMKDQVDALSKRGISSTFINSSLSSEETSHRLEKTANGDFKLLYIAPERLKNKSFRNALSSFDISFLAIDEAHCISEWGHDFRPAYLHITEALDSLGKIPVIALTATATPEVQDDIVSSLNMNEAKRFVRGFDRPNLSYITETTTEKINRVVDICKETKEGSTIIYCGSRKRVESFTEGLMQYGLKVISYHAGLADNFRKYAQEKFIDGETKIIVATNAFGMGIDKADVRNVIHVDLPSTIESYYQEAGRAGRDGNPSNCLMLYHPSDRKLQEFFIKSTFPSFENIATVYNYLFDINSTSLGCKSFDSIYLSESEIGNSINLPSIAVHSVINLLERQKILRRGSTQGLASVQITTSEERIIEYYDNVDDVKRKVFEALLRGISSEIFTQPVQFDIQHFMKKYDINFDEMKNSIRAFEFADLLRFHFPGFAKGISLLSERMNPNELPFDFDAFKTRRLNAIKKLNFVQQYAESSECKRNFILNYFRDNEIAGVCGICSSCLNLYPKDKKISSKQKYLQTKILEAAQELSGMFGKTTLGLYLKGSINPQIQKYFLEKGNYFACCKEYSLDEIKQCIEQEVYNGNLISSGDLYPTIIPSDEVQSRLRGIKHFKITRTEKSTDVVLLKMLKELRSDLAIKNKVVERAIISDVALRKIAREKPDILSKFEQISGIGQVFMKNFALSFLNLILKYKSKHNLNETSHPELAEEQKLSKETKKIIELAAKGYDLETISSKIKIPKVDVARHIQIAIESGIDVKITQLVNMDIFSEVKAMVAKKRNITLREVQTKISKNVDFASLRILLAIARKELGR
ncbi:MAG: RecQ family ATP-dependent DNA helicase [bacterium]